MKFWDITKFFSFTICKYQKTSEKRGVKREQNHIFYGFRWFAPRFAPFFNNYSNGIFLKKKVPTGGWQAGFRVWHTLTKVLYCLHTVPSEAPSGSRYKVVAIGAKYWKATQYPLKREQFQYKILCSLFAHRILPYIAPIWGKRQKAKPPKIVDFQRFSSIW